MNISLIKQTIKDEDGYCMTHYKHKPFECCCKKLTKKLEYEDTIAFTDESTYHDEPIMAIVHTEQDYDGFDDYFYTRIHYCPFCGEKININIIDEEDVSEIYYRLKNAEKKLDTKICRTDSKKREKELSDDLGKIREGISWFYHLHKYKTTKEFLDKFRLTNILEEGEDNE